jgi:hypothetical protein
MSNLEFYFIFHSLLILGTIIIIASAILHYNKKRRLYRRKKLEHLKVYQKKLKENSQLMLAKLNSIEESKRFLIGKQDNQTNSDQTDSEVGKLSQSLVSLCQTIDEIDLLLKKKDLDNSSNAINRAVNIAEKLANKICALEK